MNKTNTSLKIICLNEKLFSIFEDLLEAGIVLKGSEIKSIKWESKYCGFICSEKR